MTAGRWVLLRRVSLWIVAAAAVLLLAAGTLGLWATAARSRPSAPAAQQLLEVVEMFRRWLDSTMLSQLPGLAQVVAYDPTAPINGFLCVAAVILMALRYPGSMLVAGFGTLALRPLVLRRFRIVIDRDRVKVRCGWTRFSLPRDDNGPEPVRFRVRPPEEYYSRFSRHEIQGRRLLKPLLDLPPGVLEVTGGFKRYRVLLARRADQAEAIAARCNEAMMRTRRQLPM